MMPMDNNKPRKWWLAGLLSLLVPGVGQVYNGQLVKGIVLFVLPLVYLPIASILLNDHFSYVLMVSLLAIAVLYRLGVVVDAIVVASRYRFGYAVKKYNSAVLYVVFLLGGYAVGALGSHLTHLYIAQAYTIPSGSNIPTLNIGDCILVDMTSRHPRAGDFIAFKNPKNSAQDLVKRVVAVGGDTVEIRDKVLWRNGEPVEESYVIHTDKRRLAGPRDNFGPVTVPADQYFVLGDNRDESHDSRFLGFVDQPAVRGTVTFIYWSEDPASDEVRWDRIGTRVR